MPPQVDYLFIHPEIVSLLAAIGALVTASGLLVLLWQIRSDHERSRRENSIRIMQYWNDGYGRLGGGRKIRILEDALTDHQIRLLRNGSSFSAPLESLDALIPFVEQMHLNIDKSNNTVTVSASGASSIRTSVDHYLNYLEIVAAAYFSGTVDKKMIEKEFRTVVYYEGIRRIGHRLRQDDSIYPSLQDFEVALGKTLELPPENRTVTEATI